MKTTDSMNTYNAALEKISKMEYVVKIIEIDDNFEWKAEKKGEIFVASDPLRLLGLISSKEEFSIKNIEDHYDRILTAYYGE